MTTTKAVLRYLAANGPTDAMTLGAAIWRDRERSGRIAAVTGGGDYGMQMLLGRLRKAGLVRVVVDLKSRVSRWDATARGRKEAK